MPARDRSTGRRPPADRRRPSSAAGSSTRTRRFRARTRRPSSRRGKAWWPPGSAARARARPTSASGSRATSAAQWTAPVEVANGVQADGTRHPCWNPVLFETAPGTLTLFYKVGPSPQRWWGMTRTSRDSGRTWSEATRLPDGILGPIKNKPVRLADGTLLSPTSTESTEQPSKWRVHFERSTRWRQDLDDRPPRRRRRPSTPSSRASSFIRKAGCRRSGGRDPGVCSRRGRRTAARAGRR